MRRAAPAWRPTWQAMASETPAGSLPPTSAEPVFRARGLGKVYRMGDVQVTALRDVDLDIRRG